MSNPLLGHRINRLKDDVDRFKNVVCAYETTDAAIYPDNFQSLGIEVAMKAEALACSARNIVSAYPVQSRKYTMHAVADAQGIRISRDHEGYEIILPGLMTRRDSRYNVTFLMEPLSFALEQYFQEHYAERFENVLIWFIYEYEKDTPIRHIRDYDNLESKGVLDILNAFFLTDDSGDFCELRYSTRRADHERTRIMIRPNIG